MNTGVIRNRTNLYLSFRQSYFRPSKTFPSETYSRDVDDLHQALLDNSDALKNGGSHLAIELDTLPPAWTEVPAEVNDLFLQIARKRTTLDKLHAKHVLPSFDDQRSEEAEIQRQTASITQQFHAVQGHISKLQRLVSSGTLSSANHTLAKNILQSLAGRLQTESTNFRKSQSSYLTKLRGVTVNEDSQPTPYFLFDQDQDDPSQDIQISKQLLNKQQQQRTVQGNRIDISAREKEIGDIASSILDLSTLFKDLSTMVIDQGTVLDRIDYNVERTAEHVKGASEEMKAAEGYQQSSSRRLKRCAMLLLLLLCVMLFVVLVTKPSRSTVVSTPIDTVDVGHPPESEFDGNSYRPP